MEIEIKKTCHNCASLKSCKFVSDTSDLFKSDKFYSMFEYLEWNDLEYNFKNYAAGNCKHYVRTFQNGLIDINTISKELMKHSADQYLKSVGRRITTYKVVNPPEMVFTLDDKSEVSAIDIAGQVSLKLVK